jgi:hypothetical protein
MNSNTPMLARSHSLGNYNDNNIPRSYDTFEHNKTKYKIVENALNQTYDFVEKIKEDHKDVSVEFIIVTFDDHASIYSTLDLPNNDNNFPLIKSINKVPFLNMKEIINNNLKPLGGTNLHSVKQTNNFIELYTKEFNSIKYLLSDGMHNFKNDRDELFINTKSIFNYALGIGNEDQYDYELLSHLGKDFIKGIDEEDIHDSIIGDTFGCVSLISNNVTVNVITTAQTIKTSQSIVNQEFGIQVDESKYNSDTTFIPIMMNKNCIKIVPENNLDIENVPTNLLFVFYVDISGSMDDFIKSNKIETSSITTNISKQNITHIDTDVNSDKKYIYVETMNNKLLYNKFTLNTIDKFNTFNEIYINCDSDDPIYIELITSIGNFYYKCINDSNKYCENDSKLIEMYCYLLSELDSIKLCSHEDRIDRINNLKLLVNTPVYNTTYIQITNNEYKSRIEMYLFSIFNQIKNIANKIKLPSDILLDEMLNEAPLKIARSVSANTSRQYSNNRVISTNTYDSNSNNECTICLLNPKEVLYDCGHCVACKKCTKNIFFDIDEDFEKSTQLYNRVTTGDLTIFNNSINIDLTNDNYDIQNYHKNCPICRSHINNIRLISFVDEFNRFKCISKDCLNQAKFISENCHHLTYCEHCWNDRKSKKMLSCTCSKEINKYIKIY